MRCCDRTRPVGVVNCRSTPPGLTLSVYHFSWTVMRLRGPAGGLYDPRFDDDAGTQADYIVVEIARRTLGENWLAEYVERANRGGIERVLV